MDSDEPQKPAVGDPAGEQLKRAREKLGLSLNDIADAQHLRVSVIQAIENADYDQIDSELFLKGYVRAYAMQVGADADAIIQSLDVELEPLRRERETQELNDPLVDIERRRRKKRQVAKALLIILVLGIAAVAGWKLILEPRLAEDVSPDPEIPAEAVQPETGNNTPVAEERPERVEIPETAANDDLPGNNEPSGGTEPMNSVEPVINPEPVAVADVNQEPVVSTEADNVPEPDLMAEPVDAPGQDPAPESGISIDQVASAQPVVQLDPVFAESAQPEAVTAPVELAMSFSSDCWVQITDASGAKLVASLQRAGDQISVAGRAPLDVVIGAVDAVDSVLFDGESVDLAGFRVFNNRAEFTLTP